MIRAGTRSQQRNGPILMSDSGRVSGHDTAPPTDSRFTAELDVTGLLCPIPVLRARRVLDDLKPGELLLVIASDPASVQDMPAFCKMAGHKLNMATRSSDRYMFEIEKRLTAPTDDTVAEPIRRVT